MKAIIYKITCLTNLHVGNGESNFDIIDNAVEKDPVTGLPTINSSGVKGALRQYFTACGDDDKAIAAIFGTEQKASQEDGKKKSSPGQVKFYQADLLARPARASLGNKTNYMVTSAEAIKVYNNKAGIFGAKQIEPLEPLTQAAIGVEEAEHLCVKHIPMIDVDSPTIILEDSVLRDLPLPVLARNQLENGISKNLWYEQVVPHKSIFTFAVSSDNEAALDHFAGFLDDPAYVQFGGNASIGYGLCRVEKVERTEKVEEAHE